MPNTLVFVSIAQLNRSDSGRYRCGLERSLLPDAHKDFDINVTEGELLAVLKTSVHFTVGVRKLLLSSCCITEKNTIFYLAPTALISVVVKYYLTG